MKISIILFICTGISLFSQNINNRSLDVSGSDKLIRLPESFIVEQEIIPEEYILGPADKVGVSIFTTSHLTYILSVTPTGELWIPEISVIPVAGLSIPEAKNVLLNFLQENIYKSAKVELVLLNIRKFRVQVSGAVNAPGFINVSPIDRVTDLVHRAGGLHKSADEENIQLRGAKAKKVISLKNYQLTGDIKDNPSLKEGDHLYVPFSGDIKEEITSFISHKKSLVMITGYVNKPGGHAFISGYTIRDYLALSGGVSDMGSIKKITVFRDGNSLSIPITEYAQPGDHIEVPANLKFRYLGNISILQTVTAMMSLYLAFAAATN
jgi:protein involved in polysaccharide export with SLBB domain